MFVSGVIGWTLVLPVGGEMGIDRITGCGGGELSGGNFSRVTWAGWRDFSVEG